MRQQGLLALSLRRLLGRGKGPSQATLVDIFVSERAGGPMRRLASVEALVGRGLAGDRYASDQGYWRRSDACQVTLVTEEDLVRASARSGLSFANGEHRRNLVVRGLPLDAFRKGPVQVGEVRFVFQRLRPPCAYLDRLLQAPAAKALGRGAGLALQVFAGGRLQVGDAVYIECPVTPAGAPGRD